MSMRRYTFYFAVALLAFGIGSYVAMKSHQRISEKTLSPESKETQEKKTQQDISQKDDFPTDEQFEEWKMNSFKPVLEKWLKNQRIEEYINLERNDEWAANSEHDARTKLIDVNAGGKNELALQTGCAAVGNCEFWLFEKTKNSYKIILSINMVQQFKLKRNKSNGYFDLETKAHGSATSGGIAIYKFAGNEYKINKCFGYEYEPLRKKGGETLYTKDGQLILKDKPTLTPASCENW
jgi:hypothetical protein